jgi:hypothetical protein
MADASPNFALYVSSVPGRLVSRPGSPHAYIGARTRSPDEIKAGITEPEWFPDVVTPVLDSEYRRAIRDWDKLIRNGDLVARKAEDFAAFQKALEQAEAARASDAGGGTGTSLAPQLQQPPQPTGGGLLPPAMDSTPRDAQGTGVVGEPIAAAADGSLATLVTGKPNKGSK